MEFPDIISGNNDSGLPPLDPGFGILNELGSIQIFLFLKSNFFFNIFFLIFRCLIISYTYIVLYWRVRRLTVIIEKHNIPNTSN